MLTEEEKYEIRKTLISKTIYTVEDYDRKLFDSVYRDEAFNKVFITNGFLVLFESKKNTVEVYKIYGDIESYIDDKFRLNVVEFKEFLYGKISEEEKADIMRGWPCCSCFKLQKRTEVSNKEEALDYIKKYYNIEEFNDALSFDEG